MTIDDLKKVKIPDTSGVYLFEKGTRVLYVGKATSLKDRVRSYFNKSIVESRSALIQKMVEEADAIDVVETDSVLEALIAEANLIKKFQPRYNTKEKDDKSFNYLVITNEDFPRIILVRGSDLEGKFSSRDIKYVFGPFPYGGVFKDAMKIVRKLFPFRDACTPYDGEQNKKPCFNKQIGLCPGVCSGQVSKVEYGRTINHIKLFFEGKKSSLIRTLEQEMKDYAKKKKFEKAGEIKKTIFGLKHIQDVSLIKEELKKPIEIPKNISQENIQAQDKVLQKNDTSRAHRIEAYDVAHMGGSNTVGVMTVVENGWIKKSDYRKFNILGEAQGNDIGSLEEVLRRRLKHDEWPNPHLIVVDGAQAQVNVAKKVLDEYGYKIAIAGVVKDERHKPKGILADENVRTKYEKDILLANAEAHRFAISAHRKKSLFGFRKR
jgi:excinuclease ABC subunit C